MCIYIYLYMCTSTSESSLTTKQHTAFVCNSHFSEPSKIVSTSIRRSQP